MPLRTGTSHMQIELAATVRAAQQGDTMAMNALVDELMPYVGRICNGIALGNGEDAAQDALIAILRSLRQLREPEGLSEQEAAEVLQVATGTVKSRLHRARARFKREWMA